MMLRYSLASVVFVLGLFMAFRAAPPPAPVEAHETVDHTFEASWARRIGRYCKVDSVVISRCTVDTPLNQIIHPVQRQAWLRVEKQQGLLTRRKPDSVDIWIRGDRLPAIKGMR